MTRDDLLNRLMRHDMDAYLEMTDKYSWSVYSLIKSRISDKNKAELIYNETMNGFFQGLSGTKGNDALEALLLMYADKVCQANMGESDAAVVGNQYDLLHRGSDRFGYHLPRQPHIYDLPDG